MQATNQEGNILATDMLDLQQADEIVEKIQAAQAKGASNIVIATLPEKGKRVKLVGSDLKYFVKGVNHETGELHLKLVSPDEG